MKTEYNADKKELVTTYSMGSAKERHGDQIGERVLTITTSKHEKTISTRASVSLHLGISRVHCFSFAGDIDGDYSARLQSEACPRVSEKVIRAYHAKAEPLFAQVIEQATAHYQRQDAHIQQKAQARAAQ